MFPVYILSYRSSSSTNSLGGLGGGLGQSGASANAATSTNTFNQGILLRSIDLNKKKNVQITQF